MKTFIIMLIALIPLTVYSKDTTKWAIQVRYAGKVTTNTFIADPLGGEITLQRLNDRKQIWGCAYTAPTHTAKTESIIIRCIHPEGVDARTGKTKYTAAVLTAVRFTDNLCPTFAKLTFGQIETPYEIVIVSK